MELLKILLNLKAINHQLVLFFCLFVCLFFQESLLGAIYLCLSIYLPTYQSTYFALKAKQCKTNKTKIICLTVIWKENAPASGRFTWNYLTFAFQPVVCTQFLSKKRAPDETSN